MKNTSGTHGSIIPTNSYKEPAPITDKENPFQSIPINMDHGGKVAKTLKICGIYA